MQVLIMPPPLIMQSFPQKEKGSAQGQRTSPHFSLPVMITLRVCTHGRATGRPAATSAQGAGRRRRRWDADEVGAAAGRCLWRGARRGPESLALASGPASGGSLWACLWRVGD